MLDIEAVAVGIENRQQESGLVRMACSLGQGYLYSRPIDKTEVIRLLGDDHQRTRHRH
jgi:EAL domain-containing protein (putative c-di-GMP-specific phosphodiesterase class I)